MGLELFEEVAVSMIRVDAKECSLRRYVGKLTVNYRIKDVKAVVIGKAFARMFVPQSSGSCEECFSVKQGFLFR